MLTIASLTFREAIRKKVLHVLIGLGILVTVVSPFIPTTDEPNARIKTMLVVFFQGVMFLCVVGVILLSATSLPYEIENRTIYGILSKPISRLKIIVGKIIGFAFLSALALIILSLLNILAIRQIAARLPEGYKDILKARNEFKASRFSIQGKPHHIREGIVWIEGGRTGVAVWSFSDLCKKLDNKSYLEGEFNLKIESSKGSITTIPLVIKTDDPVSGQSKTEVFSVKADEPLTLEINPEIVQKSGTINISVFPINKTNYIGVTQEDVRVFDVQKGFVSNYAKAIVITFLKFLLIVIIAVMGSTYLSAPISMVSALIIFLCGHILDFIKDFSFLIQQYDVHEHSLPTVFKKPNFFLIYIDSILKKALECLSIILPDFKKYDSLKFLLKGITIPLETIGISLGYTALYAGVCIFISSLLFKKREFF